MNLLLTYEETLTIFAKFGNNSLILLSNYDIFRGIRRERFLLHLKGEVFSKSRPAPFNIDFTWAINKV